MRRINKQQPLVAFSDFVRLHKPRKWEDLDPNVSKESRCHILLNEQGSLSGYTEKLLDVDKADLHIDHFYKRSLFNANVFDWNNLVVDEHSPYYGADYKDNNREHGAKSRQDYDMIINPVKENPQDFFEYLSNGSIVPKVGLDEHDSQKAIRTIEVFNLNHSSLVESRCDVIRQILYMKGMTAEEVAACFQACSFQSVVEYFCQPSVFAAFM